MSFAACKIYESAIKSHVFDCMHNHNGVSVEMVSQCGGGEVMMRVGYSRYQGCADR